MPTIAEPLSKYIANVRTHVRHCYARGEAITDRMILDNIERILKGWHEGRAYIDIASEIDRKFIGE